jgi:hypothetical protein
VSVRIHTSCVSPPARGRLAGSAAGLAAVLAIAGTECIATAHAPPAPCRCGDGRGAPQRYTGACTAAFVGAKSTLKQVVGNPGGNCIFDWDCKWSCAAAEKNQCALCIGTGLAYQADGSWWWVAGGGAPDVGKEDASDCDATYTVHSANTYTFNAQSPPAGTSMAWEGFAGPWDPNSGPDCPGWQGLKQVISWTWTMP